MTGRWLWRMAAAALTGRGLGPSVPARPADRAEGLAVLLALVLAVAAILPAVLAAGAVHQHYLAVAAADRATHHQVTATVGADAVTAYGHDGGYATDPVPVSWRDSDGTQHTASAPVPPTAVRGQAVSIWVDAHDQPVDPPVTPDQAFWRGVLTACAVLGGTALLLTAALQVVCAACDRRRHTAWGRAWRATEPLWSHRPRS